MYFVDRLTWQGNLSNWQTTSDIDRFGQCQPVCYILAHSTSDPKRRVRAEPLL